MSLEQKLEQSEQLLETNEENKRQVERSRQQVRQTQNRVNAGAARVRNCQVQLQQAIAARNAAQQRAASEEDGGYVPASYDAAIASAESELSQANRELQEARRENIRATEELDRAETAHRESAERLNSVTDELRDVAARYGVEMGKTARLMDMPEGRLAAPLFQRLGMGREKVNDLRRRIAASLGIPMTADGAVVPGGGYRGYSRRTARSGGSSGGGGGGFSGSGLSGSGLSGSGLSGSSASLGGGSGAGSGGYRSPYVKTTYSGPVTYRDPQTGQRVTKMSSRTVFENRKLDPNMVVPAGTRRGNGTKLKKATTNLELMRAGKAPFICRTLPDGSTVLTQLELHHLTGEETQHGSQYFRGEDVDGSMVEIASATHDKYHRVLHLGTPSFRRGYRGKKTADGAKYDSFRKTYWKNRAAKFDAQS